MGVAHRSMVVASALLVTSLLPGATQRERWNRPMTPFHVVGNVYFVGTRDLGVYLITTPKGDILIDGALPETVPQIESNIVKLGFPLKEIRYLLNTHAHYDHSGGLAQLKRDTGAQMIASAADKPDLESGLTESFGGGWDQREQGVKVDRTIADNQVLSVGGTDLTAHITPGHTRGCTTWSMPTEENGRTYQVVFYCSTSVPGYRLIHNRSYPQIVSDYRHSFQVLQGLPCDVFLANHTGFFQMEKKLGEKRPGGPNPFIRPGELQAFVAESKQSFEQELAKQQASSRRASF